MKKRNNKDSLRDAAKYSNIAFQMLAIIGVGVAGGIYADKYVSWHFPIFTILGCVLSVVFAVYYTIKDFI